MSFNSFLTSNFHLVGIIWNAASFIFFIVPTVVLSTKLILLRSHQAIHARRPRLVLVMLLSDITYGAIILPLNWFYNIDVIQSKTFFHMDYWKRRVLFACAGAVYSASFYLFLLSISVRTWLVHFDIQFLNRHIKSKWTKFIEGATDEAMDDDFYLKYRSTLGSYSFLQWFMWGLAFLLTTFGTLSSIYTFSHPSINYAALYLDLGIVCVVVIFNAVIYYRTRKPKFQDEFDIFFELRIILFCQIFACILFGLFIMTTPLTGLPRRFAMNLILTTDMYILTACVLIFPLYYAAYNEQLSVCIMRRLGIVQDDCYRLDSPRTSRATDILSSFEKTNKFMDHLMKEFSHENLLFVIECTQFKKYIANKTNVDILSVEMDDSIPQSSIVRSDALSDVEKAQKLFDKYIRIGAVLEVNLSYGCRSSLIQMFDEEIDEGNLDLLLTAFDEAIGEVKRLMGDSHIRYKRC